MTPRTAEDAEFLKTLYSKFAEISALKGEVTTLNADVDRLKRERIGFKRNYENEKGIVKEKDLELLAGKRKLEATEQELEAVKETAKQELEAVKETAKQELDAFKEAAKKELEDSLQRQVDTIKTLREELTNAGETITGLHQDRKRFRTAFEGISTVVQSVIQNP